MGTFHILGGRTNSPSQSTAQDSLGHLLTFVDKNGRHQEENAGDEGGKGQCHGQVGYL